MSNSRSKQSSVEQLRSCFRNNKELSDLHTHLLGMGDDAFWVDGILMNEAILPPNEKFLNDEDDTLRKTLCQLVWNPYESEFLLGEAVCEIIDELRKTNYPGGLWGKLEALLKKHMPKPETNKKQDLNNAIANFRSTIDPISSNQVFVDTDRLNKLLEELKKSVDDALFKKKLRTRSL